jgi:hypothetical protein
VKLVGGLPGTATFVYGGPGDSLVIELYDHSMQAEGSFGNDVAFLIHVAAEHKPRLLALLRRPGEPPATGNDAELFGLLRDRFGDYHEVQRWLDANSIPYRTEFDSWA